MLNSPLTQSVAAARLPSPGHASQCSANSQDAEPTCCHQARLGQGRSRGGGLQLHHTPSLASSRLCERQRGTRMGRAACAAVGLAHRLAGGPTRGWEFHLAATPPPRHYCHGRPNRRARGGAAAMGICAAYHSALWPRRHGCMGIGTFAGARGPRGGDTGKVSSAAGTGLVVVRHRAARQSGGVGGRGARRRRSHEAAKMEAVEVGSQAATPTAGLRTCNARSGVAPACPLVAAVAAERRGRAPTCH